VSCFFLRGDPTAVINMEQHGKRRICRICGTWSATARYAEDKRVDPVAALEEQLSSLWVEGNNARKVTWPLALRVGRKR